jgi:hypothetical protein
VKSIVILLLFGVVGYVAYQYVDNAVPVVAPAPHTRAPAPTEPVETEAVVPDLSRVVVKGGEPLTHARVKEVRVSGIVFVADQGLFKVGFDRLPAEYEAYYGPMAIPDPVPTEAPTPQAADAATVQPTAKPRPQRNALEDAQAELVYVQKKASLEDRLKTDRDTIDRWYKQSSFVKEGQVSQSQYEMAEADFTLASAQLAQLESDGP